MMHSVLSIRPSISGAALFLRGMFSALACIGGFGVGELMAQTEVERTVAPVADVTIAGQVFLVMPAGESLRLGAVPLQVFEKGAIEAHFLERDRELARRREEMHKELEALELRVREAAEERERAETFYHQRKGQLNTELDLFFEELDLRAQKLQETIRSNAEFIHSVDAVPMPPPGIPSPNEFAAYEKRRKQWLSMSHAERSAWATALIQLNREIEAEIEKMGELRTSEVAAVDEELQQLENAIGEASDELQNASAAVDAFREEMAAFPPPTAYLDELPKPTMTGRSNADGEFAFQLRPDQVYFLHATAQRQFAGEMKDFTWLIRLEPETARVQQLLLSNHNILAHGLPRDLVEMSGLKDPSES